MSTSVEIEVVQPDLFTNYVKPQKDGLGAWVALGIPYAEWEKSVQACGNAWHSLGQQQDNIKFILADLYLAGEREFPEKFEQMIDGSVIADKKTLTRILWVGKAIPPESRHPNLSFSHHEVVARIKDATLREELLAEAETDELNVIQLTELRKEKVPSKKDAKKKAEKVAKVAKIDIQDEATLLQSGHLIIAYLEAEEAKLPFRKWPAKRLASWKPILSTLTKIARRSITKTH